LKIRPRRFLSLTLFVALSLLVYLGYSALRPAYLRYAIHNAIEYSDYEQVDRVRFLLDAGTDTENRDHTGETSLLQAIRFNHPKIALLLLSRGARVNAMDNNGVTPLLRAAARGQTEVVRELLAGGADIKAKQDGKTALEWAVSNAAATPRVINTGWHREYLATIALLRDVTRASEADSEAGR
jgi:ankyrin repeat protein